jgi:hypothetical protein
MNFSNPIPRATQPLFAEGSALRSVRDSDSVAQGWKKSDSTSAQSQNYGAAIEKLQREIGRLRHRQPGYLIPSPTGPYPFKIYQTSLSDYQNQSGTPNIGTIFDSSGTPTAINIDSTVPTNFGSSPPTVNPNTDYWRLWMVRSGFCEIRPYYSSIVSLLGETFEAIQSINGDFALQQFVTIGTDQTSPFSTDLNSGVPNGGTLVINGGPDPLNNGIGFGIWIEILPDTSYMEYPVVSVKGARFSDEQDDVWMPANQPGYTPFVIPIGVVISSGGLDNPSNPQNVIPVQLIFDSPVNRFGNGMTPALVESSGQNNVGGPPIQSALYTTPAFGPLQYRGDWNLNNSVLQHQIFYPGDLLYNSADSSVPTLTISVGSLDGTQTFYGGATVTSQYISVAVCFIYPPGGSSHSPYANPDFILAGSFITNITAPSV